MTIVICPKCSKRGSLQPDAKELEDGSDKTYWRVFHNHKEDCWLGEGPIKAKVIKDEEPPVGTVEKTFE